MELLLPPPGLATLNGRRGNANDLEPGIRGCDSQIQISIKGAGEKCEQKNSKMRV